MVAVTKMLLACENFKENATAHLKEIWRSQDFTDVTLVSSDGLKLEAHKTVLSSCSSFFRDILIENPHPSVLLYMRGVSHKELELLLEFTYTGECEVEAAELQSFLRIGKELGVQGLLEDTTDNRALGLIPFVGKEEPGISDNPIQRTTLAELNEERRNFSEERILRKEDFSGAGSSQNDELPLDEEPEHSEFDKTLEESFAGSPTKREAKEDVEIKHECLHCGKTFCRKQRLETHKELKHGREELSCSSCDYKSFSEKALFRHNRSVHEGIRFTCDQCPFQATSQGNVTVHKKNKHDGVRYKCDQCDHSVTQYHNLVKHKKSKHEGVIYQCNHCDHEVKTEAYLKKHMRTMHEGNWLQCDICDFRSADKMKLKQHNTSMHSKS